MSQGQPSSGRKDLLSSKASSPPLRRQQALQFRFGAPLGELPCLYLGDCGNVPSFLVDAGKVIRKHVETEGLFRKTGDLRRQNFLKIHVEEGGSLHDCEIHDVTSLVKFFFRLLPEPLIPCLFHDPLLACLDISALHRRKEAVQDLCFALPAHHLSCLRYFMGLLAEVAAMSHANKMTARNLAVVLTPSLIRMKSRSKLMNDRELQALPLQTALIEHLICHAASVGAMTSRTHRQSLRLLEDMYRKLKSKYRPAKGKQRKSPEKQLESEKHLLSMIADLRFRPNSCQTVPDVEMLGEPNARSDAFLDFKTRYSSCDSDLRFQTGRGQTLPGCARRSRKARQEKKEVKSRRTILLRDVPVTRVYSVDRRAEPTVPYFRKCTFDEDLFPFGWTIGPRLLESWSKVIPVICMKGGNVDNSSDWSDSLDDLSQKSPTINEETRFASVQYLPASVTSSHTYDVHSDDAVRSLKPVPAEASSSVGKIRNVQGLNTGPAAVFDAKPCGRSRTITLKNARMIQDWLMKLNEAHISSPHEGDVSNSDKKSVDSSPETVNNNGTIAGLNGNLSYNDRNSESSAAGSKMPSMSPAMSEVHETSATPPTIKKSFVCASEMQKPSATPPMPPQTPETSPTVQKSSVCASERQKMSPTATEKSAASSEMAKILAVSSRMQKASETAFNVQNTSLAARTGENVPDDMARAWRHDGDSDKPVNGQLSVDGCPNSCGLTLGKSFHCDLSQEHNERDDKQVKVGKCLRSCPSPKSVLPDLSCELPEQAAVSKNRAQLKRLSRFYHDVVKECASEQGSRKTGCEEQAKVSKPSFRKNFKLLGASNKDTTTPGLLLDGKNEAQPGPPLSDNSVLLGMEFFHNQQGDAWESDRILSPKKSFSSATLVWPTESEDGLINGGSWHSITNTDDCFLSFYQSHSGPARVSSQEPSLHKCHSLQPFPSKTRALEGNRKSSVLSLHSGMPQDKAESAPQLSESKLGQKKQDNEGRDEEASTAVTEIQQRNYHMNCTYQFTEPRVAKKTVDSFRRSKIAKVPVTRCDHAASSRTGATSNRYFDGSSLSSAAYGSLSKPRVGAQEETNVPTFVRQSRHRKQIQLASDLYGNATSSGVCGWLTPFGEWTQQNVLDYEKMLMDLKRQLARKSNHSYHINPKLPVSRVVLSDDELPKNEEQASGQTYPPSPKLRASFCLSAPASVISQTTQSAWSKGKEEQGRKNENRPTLQSVQRLSANMRTHSTKTDVDATMREDCSPPESQKPSERKVQSRPQQRVTSNSKMAQAVLSPQLDVHRQQPQVSTSRIFFGHSLTSKPESGSLRSVNEEHGKTENPPKDGVSAKTSPHRSAGDSISQTFSRRTLEGSDDLADVPKDDQTELTGFGRRSRSVRRQTRAIYRPLFASNLNCFTSGRAANPGEINDEYSSSILGQFNCLRQDNVEMSQQRDQMVKISGRQAEVGFGPAASNKTLETHSCERTKRQLSSSNAPRSDKLQISDIQKNVELLSRAFESLELELKLGSCSSRETDTGEMSSRSTQLSMRQGRAMASPELMSRPTPGNRTRKSDTTDEIRDPEPVCYDPPLPLNTSSTPALPSVFVIQRQETTIPPCRPLDESSNCRRQALPSCLSRRNHIRNQSGCVVLGTVPGMETSNLNFNRNYSECMVKLESIRATPRKAVFAPNGDIVLKFITRSLS